MKKYIIKKNGFSTYRSPVYRVDRGSVLHSGIYNREMASTLTASTIAGGIFIWRAFIEGVTAGNIAIGFAVFAAGFVLFRATVFRERDVVFEVTAKGKYSIKYPMKKPEEFSTEDIQGLEVKKTVIPAENPDGIKVVEKIALQHGTVIPGFGKELKLYSVELNIKDIGSRTLYADIIEDESLTVKGELEEFIKNA